MLVSIIVNIFPHLTSFCEKKVRAAKIRFRYEIGYKLISSVMIMIIHRTIDVSIVQWPAIKTSHHFSVT
jgi:hypothetical protein